MSKQKSNQLWLAVLAAAVVGLPMVGHAQFGGRGQRGIVVPQASQDHYGRAKSQEFSKSSLEESLRSSGRQIGQFFGRLFGRQEAAPQAPQPQYRYPQQPYQASPAQPAYRQPGQQPGQGGAYPGQRPVLVQPSPQEIVRGRALPTPQAPAPPQGQVWRQVQPVPVQPQPAPARPAPPKQTLQTQQTQQTQPMAEAGVEIVSPQEVARPSPVVEETPPAPREISVAPVESLPDIGDAPPLTLPEIAGPEEEKAGQGAPAKVQEPVVEDVPEEKAPETVATSAEGKDYPMAAPAKTRGHVISPFEPRQELDVTGISSGELAVNPRNGKVFRVP